uniref:monogalactosyldiacylglycerol synthase n=1 Tax=Helicotheca tamesis TaxID=374047 RepID=A0A7S2GRS4_9STRA|mmetsp:Transcript_10264/g.14340  ORF Transcript_10264/g.14340 Transcript_10264/m.14340 type:complete len:626 (+) Transcript_10264:74-1951(+)|eukprot:CAMPEP_0185736302 /NCGR_PEP_ID=MMETSP1171-20130828/27465_1 /TAXON_ID=374046 /ORGANISM="Helicotheca tamensis, Strain CCMP826" /LENGTH=625 /DNA_ID=CAMNT_0028406861 /DNA_START=71 /DNA_END=1948 /DNA_ORIENTATION=-
MPSLASFAKALNILLLLTVSGAYGSEKPTPPAPSGSFGIRLGLPQMPYGDGTSLTRTVGESFLPSNSTGTAAAAPSRGQPSASFVSSPKPGGASFANAARSNISPKSSTTALAATASSSVTPPDGDSSSTSAKKTQLSSTLAPIEEAAASIKSEINALPAVKTGRALRVLFLSSDTGGGHRASAMSLANQFQRLYPGTTYDLLDIWTEDGCYPYRTLVKSYKHLSANPAQWRLLYYASNTYPYEFVMNHHSMLTCERKIRRRIESYRPDVVISVHPTMNNVPIRSTRKISKKLGRHIPFFTVVTDFGSGHCTWFHNGVDKMFIASDRIEQLAKKRSGITDDKLVMSGLPIRYDFAIQAEKMGDRTTEEGKEYQRDMKKELGVNPDKPMVLVMGGGEGVGSLSDIVNAMYARFVKMGIDATICVVCGRNEELKKDLDTRDWAAVVDADGEPKKRKRDIVYYYFHKAVRSKKIQASLDRAAKLDAKEEEMHVHHEPGKVDVVGLGFVTNMAEYMVGANILVSKAGPGTIAEAAAVGLPVMLTSYLPGQEAGNVDVVLDGGFGDYCEDPVEIARELSCWLRDEPLIDVMSNAAMKVGHPHAAERIVAEIGDTTIRWKEQSMLGSKLWP